MSRMKRVLLSVAGAAIVFAAGYWSGSYRGPGGAGFAEKTGPVTSAIGKAGVAGNASGSNAAASPEVRPFQAGRPFPPGGAKAWLLSIVAQLGKGGIEDAPIEAIDLAQVF